MSGTVPISPRADLTGQDLGCYRVLRLLDRGGMGVVYEATHLVLGRRAAIKVLHNHLVKDREAQQRLLTEARAESMLLHPGVVSIFDIGATPGGSIYMAMEFLDGQTLAARILDLQQEQACSGPDPGHLRYAIRLVKELAVTLRFIHKSGVIHRDLKPENIFLVRDPDVPDGERVKVLDFGIAKLQAGNAYHLPAPVRGLTRYEPTQLGAVLGTPAYRAPEMERGEPAEAAVDVYSLGCVLYELIEGTRPFPASEMAELRLQHLYGPIPVLQRYRLLAPPELNELIRCMLAKSTAARPSMANVVDVLRLIESRLCTPYALHPAPSSRLSLSRMFLDSFVGFMSRSASHWRPVLAVAAVLILIVVTMLAR